MHAVLLRVRLCMIAVVLICLCCSSPVGSNVQILEEHSSAVERLISGCHSALFRINTHQCAVLGRSCRPLLLASADLNGHIQIFIAVQIPRGDWYGVQRDAIVFVIRRNRYGLDPYS